MRTAATGLLVVMVAIYIASYLVAQAPWAGPLRAFSEAAVVGGCADWFAVTALFRRPFNLPIPHTAIIPRAKDRIGEALGRFIVDNFLSPRTLDAKLRDFKLAAWGGTWLQQPNNARALTARILTIATKVSHALPRSTFEEVVEAAALAAAKAIPAAPTAATILEALWVEDRVQSVVTRLTAFAKDYLKRNQTLILEKVQGQSWRWLPGFVDKAIAAKLTNGLIQLLEDVQDADHPWRLGLRGAAEAWIARLERDPALRAQAETLKMQILANPALIEQVRRLWADVERQLRVGSNGDPGAFSTRLAKTLSTLGCILAEDRSLQRSLNTSARVFVRRVLSPRRHEIGRYVAHVVQGWDASLMVSRLELQVGPDLQFIRVNGTIVGGLVGLVLYACAHLFNWR